MPFSKGDNNINRQGRPKDSLNNSTLLKKEILSQHKKAQSFKLRLNKKRKV